MNDLPIQRGYTLRPIISISVFEIHRGASVKIIKYKKK